MPSISDGSSGSPTEGDPPAEILVRLGDPLLRTSVVDRGVTPSMIWKVLLTDYDLQGSSGTPHKMPGSGDGAHCLRPCGDTEGGSPPRKRP